MDDVLQIIHRFQITGTPKQAKSYGGGHINETYKIITLEKSQPDYLLQKINQEVFSNVDALMENIYKVTEHIKSKASPGRQQVLTIIPTKEGRLFYHDQSGNWRVFEFIVNAKSYDKAETKKQAFEAARMFGQFLRDLSDFPVEELNITIPDFHNIDFRLQQFKEALSDAKTQRIKKAQKQIKAVRKNSHLASELYDSATSGELPLRVTHNDTKFNNILLDKDGYGYAVVDLDTVMPGYVFYDVGDGIRTGVVTAEEDEQNLDLVTIDGPKYEAYLKGYLEGAGDILTGEELESISMAGFYMAFIMGVRFLTDYLNGNVYYKVGFPEHNYYRARCQLHVAELLIEKAEYTMELVLNNEKRAL